MLPRRFRNKWPVSGAERDRQETGRLWVKK